MNRTQLRPDSVTLHQQARACRSRLIGTMLARLARAIVRRLTLTGSKRHAILDAQART